MSFKVGFELTSEMPLLMHADDVLAADELMAWRKDPANKNLSVPGDDRSPPWTWQTYLYSDGTHVTIPAENLMANLRYAATQIIMKKQKTFKEVSQSGMVVTDEYLDFFCDGKQIPMAEIAAMRDLPFADQSAAFGELGGGMMLLFVKRARVGTSKHVRVRPRFNSWSVKGVMQVLVPEITFAVLEQMFEIGGRGGLCDWRPNCKTPGPYGMYAAKLKKM